MRESDTYPGEFSLSVWLDTSISVVHCRIRHVDGKYFLTDHVSFSNLYALIEYYRREVLVGAKFEVKLTDRVPPPPVHEVRHCPQREGWFMIRRLVHNIRLCFSVVGITPWLNLHLGDGLCSRYSVIRCFHCAMCTVSNDCCGVLYVVLTRNVLSDLACVLC